MAAIPASSPVTFGHPLDVGELSSVGENIMTARFELRIDPDDCACPVLAMEFPALDIRIVALFPLGNGLVLTDVEVRGELSDHALPPKILEVSRRFLLEVLGSSSGGMLLRMTARAGLMIDTLQALCVAPMLPIQVEEDRLFFNVRASRQKIQQMYSRLREGGADVVLGNLSRTAARTRGSPGGLTTRQLELYRMARNSGYWDTPRRITLTEIAKVLGLSKSAVSEVLATIERKVLKEGLDPLGL